MIHTEWLEKDDTDGIGAFAGECSTFNSELVFGFRANFHSKDYFIISKKSGRWILWVYDYDDTAINDITETEPELAETIKEIEEIWKTKSIKNFDEEKHESI